MLPAGLALGACAFAREASTPDEVGRTMVRVDRLPAAAGPVQRGAMKTFERMLANNREWAAARVQEDPDYFRRLANIQTPEVLWIGCSDSRVAANVITGTQPGEIFVHRNVGNLVVNTDVNLLSVLEYAVDLLHVKHVIVCGHYGCGGVRAAMTHDSLGIINTWLRNLKDVYRFHEVELLALPGAQARQDRLVELNVEEQVLNLAKTAIVQKAWKHAQRPVLHGWVYGLADGILKPIKQLAPGEGLEGIYRYENL